MAKKSNVPASEVVANVPEGTTASTTVAPMEATGVIIQKPFDPNSVTSLNDVFAALGNVPVPKQTATKVAESSAKDFASRIPELAFGFVQPDGTPYPGAVVVENTDPSDPDFGCKYVYRLHQKFLLSDAAYLLNHFGMANRTVTAATVKRYAEAMQHGKWRYVFNTAIFTVLQRGQITLTGVEQHNLGHTCHAMLLSGIPYIWVDLKFGIPVEYRDKIDDNQGRSIKDIVSTRTDMKEMFAVGTQIGGAVTVNAQLQKTMNGAVSETFRIVDDIRHGKNAKEGGSRDKQEAGAALDEYIFVIGNAVSQVVALDSRLQTLGKEGKVKANGGLTKRIALNHAASALVLAAGYRKADGSFGWCQQTATKVLTAFMLLGNESVTDASNPMVCLRQTIDGWNNPEKPVHKGSSGMNVRFSALKIALDWQLRGIKTPNIQCFQQVQPTDGRDVRLNGYSDVSDSVTGKSGLDDYVNVTKALLAAAEAAKSGSANPDATAGTPLIAETTVPETEVTGQTSDVPEVDE